MTFPIFNCPLFTFSKHWNLDMIGYWVIGAVCLMEKDLELTPSPPNYSNLKKYCSCLYLSIGIVWWLKVLWFKKDIQKCTISCTHTHDDVTDGSSNHGMAKTTKTWMSWELNITFPRNKKILNLCLRWHIFRSYRFVAEVTFKVFT